MYLFHNLHTLFCLQDNGLQTTFSFLEKILINASCTRFREYGTISSNTHVYPIGLPK